MRKMSTGCPSGKLNALAPVKTQIDLLYNFLDLKRIKLILIYNSQSADSEIYELSSQSTFSA